MSYPKLFYLQVDFGTSKILPTEIIPRDGKQCYCSNLHVLSECRRKCGPPFLVIKKYLTMNDFNYPSSRERLTSSQKDQLLEQVKQQVALASAQELIQVNFQPVVLSGSVSSKYLFHCYLTVQTILSFNQ